MGKRMSGQQRKPRIVDHISDDSDDEEIDEDEAFNSEDERKYGSFFHKSSFLRDFGNSDEEEESGNESDEIASDDEEEDEGDGGQYMLDLLDKLDDKDNVGEDSAKKPPKIANHVKESQFSSTVLSKANVTLDTLMEGIKDTSGFGNIQKTMKKVSQGHATTAPVARVVSDRAQRKVHYENQTQQVSEWIDAVQQNRQAETLDFRPKQRLEVTRDILVDKFTPTTDFEKQLHAALEEAGQQDEQAILKAEEKALQDDLGANQITLEEYKKRRGQLAKMRALMFYHEQKRHHINKIKSKKYRRIRKKQRERQKEAEVEAQVEENPDLERELEEKEEMERMKERMTLAHKNTSKWAKRILKRGKNVDVDTRRALSAQLKRGDDLRKKMKTTDSDDEDDSDEDLVETAKKVLADTEQEEDAVKGEGLFKLSFMQRGVERQRQQARQEARQLLMELEANERIEKGSESENEGAEAPDRQRSGNKNKVASKEEMKHVLKDGEMVASSLRFSNSTATQVSGSISIDMGEEQQDTDGDDGLKDTSVLATTNTSEHKSTLESSEQLESTSAAEPNCKPKSPKNRKSQTIESGNSAARTDESSNPWLVESPEEKNPVTMTSVATGGQERTTKNKKTMAVVDIDRAVDLLSTSEDRKNSGRDDGGKDETGEETSDNKKILTLTQEELVRKAFAGTTVQDAQEEFDREKREMAEREDPNRKKRNKQNEDESNNRGWGCWAGMGAPPPPKKKKRLPKKLQPPPEQKLPTRKRQDDVKPAVIISERRIKRLADQFMVAQIPYPFTSREEYERAMAGGVGREWNVTNSFKEMTRPEIQTRAGKIIQPLSKKVKHPRSAAKF